MEQTKQNMEVRLSVREMGISDVDSIADYWLKSEKSDLFAMGVDLTKIPTRAEFINMLLTQLNTPIDQKKSYCIIWELNGKAIGHCNTNPTLYGEEAFMHLHLWKPSFRQLGYGKELVRLTLPYFFKMLTLKRLYCEPYALNAAPNKTLEKLGFRFVKEYITTPGSITFEQPVNQWIMTKETYENTFMARQS